MYYVYILRLNDGSYYSGMTDNLKRRVAKHNKGDVLSTKAKRPVTLVFYCAFPTKTQAADFEQYLKTGSGQSFRNRHFVA